MNIEHIRYQTVKSINNILLNKGVNVLKLYLSNENLIKNKYTATWKSDKNRVRLKIKNVSNPFSPIIVNIIDY